MLLLFFILLCSALELSFPSLENRFLQLVPETSPCITDALAEFIAQCSEKGVEGLEPDLRLRLAVRLSVCEFIEAGVQYPSVCNLNDYKACVQQFRDVAQMWTTYSGNYRKLRSVCFEEALPFVKHDILNLFLNVTKVYAEFYGAASESYVNLRAYFEDFARALSDMKDAARESEEMVKLNQEHQESAMADFRRRMLFRFEELDVMLDSIMRNQLASADDTRRTIHRSLEESVLLNEKLVAIANLAENQELSLALQSKAINSNTEELLGLLETTLHSHDLAQDVQSLLALTLKSSASFHAMMQESGKQLDRSLASFNTLMDEIVVYASRQLESKASERTSSILSKLDKVDHFASNISLHLESQLANISSTVKDLQDGIFNLRGINFGIKNFGRIFLIFGHLRFMLLVGVIVGILALRSVFGGTVVALILGGATGLWMRLHFL